MTATIDNSSDVLVFFGNEVKNGLTDSDFQNYSNDCILLPLDVAAIGEVVRSGVPYTLIDDWLGPGVVCQARAQASLLEKTWFETAKEACIAEGICWPAFDRHAMHWFWQTFTLAVTLAEEARRRPESRLRFFESSNQRPGLYYYSSDVCPPIWQALLGDRAWALELPKCDGESRKFTLRRFIRRLTKAHIAVLRLTDRVSKRGEQPREDYRSASYSELKHKVVLAINPGEAQRSSFVVRQLKTAFPEGVAAVLLTPRKQTAATISNEWDISVACGPQSSAPLDANLTVRFQRGVSEALASISEDSWRPALESLSFHFNYYCNYRWPSLVTSLRFWSDLWRQIHPRAVLISSLYDSESQLPGEAARRLGIPTFSIPHGGVTYAENLIASEHVLYSYLTQEMSLGKAGLPKRRLLPCRALVSESEYEATPSQHSFTRADSWKVLVITENISICGSGCLYLKIRPRAQLKTLEMLGHPPADVSSQLDLYIKVHPGYPDLELFHAIGMGLPEKVLPVNMDLHSVLPHTDLVVALNYYGSALIHVLRAGKPVILFWTDTEAETYAYGDVFLPAGPVASTPEELWDLIRRFFTDPETAEQMRLQAREFCRNYLDDSNYPSIGEVVGRVLSQSK